MKKIMMFMLFAMILSMALVSAQPREYYEVGNDTLSSVFGNDWKAQRFGVWINSSATFNITHVQILMTKQGLPPADLHVNITETNQLGSITNWLVGNATVKTSTIGTGIEWFNITIPETTLEYGKNYSVVMYLQGGDASNRIRWAVDSSSADYPFDLRSSGTGGTNWAPVIGSAGLFRIYGTQYQTVFSTLNAPSNDSSLFLDTIEFNMTGLAIPPNLTNMTFYIYNETAVYNETYLEISGVENLTSLLVSNFQLGTYHWNARFCANSSLGSACSLADNNNSFNWGYQFNSQEYNSTTTEVATESFVLNLSVGTGTTATAELIYNNTIYSSAKEVNNNERVFKTSIIVPEVDASTNNQFEWNLTLTKEDKTQDYIVANGTQTIVSSGEILVSTSCEGDYVPALSFNVNDEGNLSAFNTSIEYNVKYGVSNLTSKLVYGEFPSAKQFHICINNTQSGTFKVGEAQFAYGEGSYVERFYYLFEGVSLTNITSNHTLFNLKAVDATSFLVKVRDAALTPYADKYVTLLRWYPQINEYKVVEMGRTSEDGETPMKTVVEDVDYRAGVYEKNGELIKLTDPFRMVCLVNPCELNIVVTDDEEFTSFLEVEASLTYNETTGFRFIWNDPNQETSLMNITVYKLNTFGKTIVCNNFASGFTGVLTCDVSHVTDGTLQAIVERSASPPIPIDSMVVELGEKIASIASGTFGLFMAVVLVIFIGLIGIVNPVIAVIAGVIALIPALLMGAINLAIITAIAVAAAVIIHFMKKSG
jgi:hypothetical protein